MAYTTSATGLALLRKHEGFRAKPAQIGEGVWLVGYGHVHRGAKCAATTQEKAKLRLAADLRPIEKALNKTVNVAITQSQFDALVCFAFSISLPAFLESDVLKRVNAGDFIGAACAMDAWRRGDSLGKVVEALVRRRATEKALFLKDLPVVVAPSALVRPQLDHAALILAEAAAPGVSATPRRSIGVRLTEILQSEPATAAVLAAPSAPMEDIPEEITTAHAKPVARPLAAVNNVPRPLALVWKRRAGDAPHERVGHGPLMLLGVALMLLGGSLLLAGRGAVIDIIGALALITPGVAATSMALTGWKRDVSANP
ncbi:MAG: lysozyme [Hyphomonadaceae bacterium]|nr:lysozyme [Hyphomonadaceae bacterium]